MSSNPLRKAVLTAVLAAVLVAAGCTGTEVLQSGGETLTVELELVNPDTRFESAYFEIRQISLRPLDPDADAALQADAIGALRLSMEVSYRDTQTLQATASLGEGVYQVTSVVLGAIAYTDLDGVGPNTSCQTYVASWQQPNRALIITDFGEDVFVTVEAGGDNTLRLIVDGAALSAAFLDSWLCNSFPACQPIGTPWCLLRLQDAVFIAQSEEFLEFPQQ
jgi:hypothetical protein